MRLASALSDLFLLLALSQPCSAADRPWHAEARARWIDLEVPARGKAGFTLLPPSQTALGFTNSLDEWSSAANRVLENGSGVAAGDFDRDGRPDIFFCSLTGQNALYRNLGNWAFENVTQAAGLGATNFVCRGAVFSDLNGDGWPDLLVSTLGQGVLCFLNDGQGHFADASAKAGTREGSGSTTLALADVDGDGAIDLYVANYRADDIRDRCRIEVRRVDGQVVFAPSLRDRLALSDSGLIEFGEPDMLYLNDGQARFRPVSWTGGAFLDEEGQPLRRAPRDWGLTASFRDLNADGLPDLYVCNDYWTPDRIWINQGGGRFRALPRLAIRHTSENSMGVDFADVDRDGAVDILVLDMLSRDPALRKRQALAQTRMLQPAGDFASRLQVMRNTFFHARGDGTYEEIASFSGLTASDWSWQPVFVDVDLDGYQDLVIPAGHRKDVQDLDATTRIASLQHPWPKNINPEAHQQAFTREMLEHARLYPPRESPIITFRNLGDLHFAETTSSWGTAAPGVHQGIAFADFDGDGDLDFAVNNLNANCGLYRNDSVQPRVVVELKGRPPNTEGVGARVALLNGPVARQQQEMVSAGRYLSGFQPVLVFAAARQAEMSLEVVWRSGLVSRVDQVRANRRYQIEEEGAEFRGSEATPSRPAAMQAGTPPGGPTVRNAAPPALDNAVPAPWFADVSDRISHAHPENEFDDFARQPLLLRKLSQLGPGVGWSDLDGDGHQDLAVGSGRGGALGLFHNLGGGAFKPLTGNQPVPPVTRDQTGIVLLSPGAPPARVLVGSANYEDALAVGASVRQFDAGGRPLADAFPGHTASTGPLALGDLEGDSQLSLFVGGRVIPGRYPEPADSRIFHNAGEAWQLDAENSRALERVGLVSGAVWSDLDGDGDPDLILACEWGPIRVFRNESGHLHEATAAYGLDRFFGWWMGVTAGDLDGDGRMDIVAANWGLNAPYQASPARPLLLYYGDFTDRGGVDLFETEFDPLRNATVPRHRLDRMAAGLPFLRERYTSFKGFSEATAESALAHLRSPAAVLSVTTLASTVFLNRGGRFEASELPREAQFSPAFGVNVADFDGDGHEDVFLAQNFFDLPWEEPRLDAGRGLLLRGDGTGKFTPVPGQVSGIALYGEQRGSATADFDEDGRVDLAVAQNGSVTRLYRNGASRPGLRVALRGPAGNPSGVGAVMRLGFGDRFGPAREVHAGSGYLSQDSAVQVLATPDAPDTLWVRWPGGRTTTSPVPRDAREIRVDFAGAVQVVK